MKRVLFGAKPDWQSRIEAALDTSRYAPRFSNFAHETDFAAYDLVVPLQLSDYRALQRTGQDTVRVLMPSRAAVAILDDKLKTIEMLCAGGFGEHVPDVFVEAFTYPLIYKKRRDQFGTHSKVIVSAGEDEAFRQSDDIGTYFRQRYVQGRTEYTTHIISLRGKIAFDASYEFSFAQDHFVKGVQARHEQKQRVASPFLDLFARILAHIDYTGTCCFNFKIENGTPLIFEINPRFGGTLCPDINAYLNAYASVVDAATIRKLK